MANKRFQAITGFILFIAILSTAAVFLYSQEKTTAFWSDKDPEKKEKKTNRTASSSKTALEKEEKKNQDKIKKVDIESGINYIDLMKDNGLDYEQAIKIYNTAKDKYDLAGISAGKCLEMIYTPEDKLKRIVYEINSNDRLVVENNTLCRADEARSASDEKEKWSAKIESIPYKTEVEVSEGNVESSFYSSALDQGLDERTIIKFAEAFQWTVDFAMGVRKGDTFKLVYEKKYLDGEYVRPGRILAARYVNDGEEHELYYYEGSGDEAGYFTYEGESAQKMFLKAPVAYKHISSGYSTGPRYISKFKTFTSSHKAIDYAAETGTPIRAVGDGVVTSAGWSSAGYGYLTTIRHNSTYTTKYAHQARIDVSAGEKVKQGDVIGTVGSTGFSTGPHLHYEMIKNGAKINPLSLELPAGESVSSEKMEDFHKSIEDYKQRLDR
ncbi:MAG: peptidoglycan DD-metalloendopeptidase family protein [Patescibacteria group bacterium]